MFLHRVISPKAVMSRLVLANPKNGLVEWFDSILGGDSQVAKLVDAKIELVRS